MADHEVATKRRRLNDGTGVDTDDGPVENQTRDNYAETPDYCAERLFDTVTTNGDVFPKFPVQSSPEEHVRGIKTMPVREDDVIIASFPNSGARWIWEMTRMVLTGQTEHDSRTKEHATIELNEADDIEAIQSPRVLSSHLHLRQLSNEIVTKRTRVIHVMRNPKDLVVSRYFRKRQMGLFHDKGLQDFVMDFLSSSECQGTCMDYFTYLHEMMTWQKENPEVPTVNIFYEDVCKSPVQCVQDLAHFLQLPHVTDALCADIADQCSFHNLQDVHEDGKAKDHPSTILYRNHAPNFFRKGEVGDWKNHFTMALNEHFDAVLAERLPQYSLAFQYALH